MADIHRNDEGTSDVETAEPPSSKAIINLANHLLKGFNISLRVGDVSDISASLFVVLYESMFSDRLPGIIRQPMSKEDEIHNCQIVIDVLSTEVVRDSLSHIRGADIIAGDNTAILNLLDIFSYLLEYVVKRIENDADLNESSVEADSEIQSKDGRPLPQKVTDMPRDKLASTASSNTTNNNGAHLDSREKSKLCGNRNESIKAFDNREVISHEDFYAMSYGGLSSKNTRPPSPIRADLSQSLLGQKTIDSDFEPEFPESGQWDGKGQDFQRDQPKFAWEAKESKDDSGPSEAVIDGVTLRGKQTRSGVDHSEVHHYTFTHHLYHHYASEMPPQQAFSASMPAPERQREFTTNDPLRSTVGPIQYRSELTGGESKPEKAQVPLAKGLSSSYTDLRELVERTAALTRVALATSPVRVRTALDLDITDISQERPRPVIPSRGARLAKELNAQGLNSASSRDGKSPGKPVKKVEFASPKDSGIHGYDYHHDIYGDLLSVWKQTVPDELLSDSESDYLSKGSPPRKPRKQDNGRNTSQKKPSKLQTGGQKKTSANLGRNEKFAKYLAQNRQPELGAAHMTLKTEDRAIRRKKELLRQFYEQDHKEFAEDVEYLLERDKQKSKELEEECIKKCSSALLRKKPSKAGKVTGQTVKRARVRPTSATTNHKEKEKLSSATGVPLHIESEEDLLPALLDEFPHLHLSEHTWHELWRRGLHQIEALTRSHEESQRKKSHAQCQLEEAAERHELLADIMKKQLEHAKRLRDIKEQKHHQISTRNKMHEKRIQSARARRYYNEYQVRARAKQLKRRTKEEMVFRELFKDALNIQKERIRDVRQYATDQRRKQESRRQNEIDSMENFYHDQFEMLAEKLSKERQETEVRDAAQQKIMNQLKRELRKKMESEIEQYQEQLFRDDDDVHFRKADADRVLRQLHLARYSAKI